MSKYWGIAPTSSTAFLLLKTRYGGLCGALFGDGENNIALDVTVNSFYPFLEALLP